MVLTRNDSLKTTYIISSRCFCAEATLRDSKKCMMFTVSRFHKQVTSNSYSQLKKREFLATIIIGVSIVVTTKFNFGTKWRKIVSGSCIVEIKLIFLQLQLVECKLHTMQTCRKHTMRNIRMAGTQKIFKNEDMNKMRYECRPRKSPRTYTT